MPLYDLMLLLDPGAPSDRQETILRDVQGLLESGGNVVGNFDWGTRRMTFEIDHRPDAAYHLFQFETEGGGALLEQVDHSLKIMDGVLRHRIIRLKEGSPPPPMPTPDRRGGYEEYQASDAATQKVDQPEGGQPADAPATAGTAAAEQPAAPADAPAPAPAETPPPPDVADQEAGPAGGGGDDVAPSGPTAA
ncbi:MAG TPA: 30S ribosomal protein S6 [Thermoleophilaceae bacterium]|jgi:small subunit ribosomal protein S6|nr:30S ribosomal protein S6 [Thermoleophilaceae bacterium]